MSEPNLNRSVGDVPTIVPPGALVGQPTATGGPPTSDPSLARALTVTALVAPPGYTIEGELGRGGMGVVYLARQSGLNRPVALKMILSGEHAEPRELVRFLAEAEAIGAVKHPHVVQVYEFGEHGGRPFMALEFCGGGSLAAVIRTRGAFSPDEAARLVEKLALGVQAAHALAIVHRDLKPHNVLLDESGEPKVTDFGLAKRGNQADLTRTGAVIGTPAYMAPEQAQGKTKFIGPAADTYALGVILFELLTGRVPFQAEDTFGLILKVASEEPPSLRSLNRQVPRDLEVICLKCLQKDPGRRYPTAAALAEDLRSFLDGRPIAARPVGVLERAWKWAKRHPGRAAGFAAGVLLTVGLLAAANEERKQRELDRRETRAAALVEALGTAETAGVPRLLDDLAEFRDLTGPKLRELADQQVSTKPGLHARLALLTDEPGWAVELAAYLPTCRPEELLPVRDLLKPHVAAVAPALWAVLMDENVEPGKRVRAAGTLAGLAPSDPRWPTIAGRVVDGVVGSNPLEAMVWAQALEPVRVALLPSLLKRYPEAQGKMRSGKLSESELVGTAAGFDLTATLLARYLTDRPAELTELAMRVDARHHTLFQESIRRNRVDVVRILTAELGKTAAGWQDPPPDPAWKPIDPVARKMVSDARGLIHDRFAFVQAVPLDGLRPLADALSPLGYRPIRVRPYVTSEGVKVAAVWQRDGVAWKLLTGANENAVLARTGELRRARFQPVDVAAWSEPGTKSLPFTPAATALGGTAAFWAASTPPLAYAVVYEATTDRRPVTSLLLGIPDKVYQLEFDRNLATGKRPLTIHRVSDAVGQGRTSGVLRPDPSCWEQRTGLHPEGYAKRESGLIVIDVSVYPSEGNLECGAVWREIPFEQSTPTLVSMAEHLDRAAELAKRGWTIQAIAVLGERVSSIWHRPPIVDAGYDDLARRRANAAAVLLTLGEVNAVWPLFRFPTNGDPSVRSYLIARAAAIGADPAALIGRFRTEGDGSAKRALLIALGDFPLSAGWAGEREAFARELLTLYREHPDPGLHGAIDWLLRQKWRKAADVGRIDSELANLTRAARRLPWVAGSMAGLLIPMQGHPRRDWFVNGEGQTYAVVRGPVEFMIGSPMTELERFPLEFNHPKRIGRSFAIATKEVTMTEFLRFLPGHSWTKRLSPDRDSPAVGVTWYAAAEYCNELSRREGIPEDQWCYVRNKDGNYADGMTTRPGHLALAGYRLPTEAEWEYACRAGSVTSRYFGRSAELLDRYGWYLKTADERSRPVGQLRPNDLGLFDALGNVFEWADGPAFRYCSDTRDDLENETKLILEEQDRILRGGSFNDSPKLLRCAQRLDSRPGWDGGAMGFRPVRTLLD